MALLEHLGETALGKEISHIRRFSHPRRLCPPHPHLAQNLGRLNESRANSRSFIHLAQNLGEMNVRRVGGLGFVYPARRDYAGANDE